MVLGGVLLAVLANLILGTIYYSPAVLGKPWIRLTGAGPDKMKKDQMIFLIAGGALLALFNAGILALLMPQYEVSSYYQALLFGGILWFGFMMPTIVMNNMYQMKPIQLSVIDSGFQLVSILTMSVILYLFL